MGKRLENKAELVDGDLPPVTHSQEMDVGDIAIVMEGSNRGTIIGRVWHEDPDVIEHVDMANPGNTWDDFIGTVRVLQPGEVFKVTIL